MPRRGAVVLVGEVKSTATAWSSPAKLETVAMYLVPVGSVSVTSWFPLIPREPESSSQARAELLGLGQLGAPAPGLPMVCVLSARVKASQKKPPPPPLTTGFGLGEKIALLMPSLAVSVTGYPPPTHVLGGPHGAQ